MTQTHNVTLTAEQAALLELHRAAPDAFRREVESLLGRWCGEAVRRMRILVNGCTLDAREEVHPEDGMLTFDDLLARAERYGLRAQLDAELDDIRARWLFRRNQTPVPNRHAA